MSGQPFTFICGADDFLVGRQGQARFAELAREVTDEFSREILSGFANNVDEVAAAIHRLRESVRTVPMFGGRRAVWFKDVNFLADTVTGRAESTLQLVGELQELLGTIDPASTALVISAAPVDRRRAFPKWCERHAEFILVGGEAGDLEGVVLAEARQLGATLTPGAAHLLLARIGANSRLLIEEVRKLATYAAPAGTAAPDPVVIEEHHVAELTPNAAEGDFFETAEAFFRGDLKWTLAALQRHFFTGGDARPVIASLQNRNRLLIQLRALLDAGGVRQGARGLNGLAQAGTAHAAKFGDAAGAKSSFNIFSQNPWYVGKLSGDRPPPSLRRLIANQQEFVRTFEELIQRPRDQEQVLRELAIRCLAAA